MLTTRGEIIRRYDETLDTVLVVARILKISETEVLQMPASRVLRYFNRFQKLKEKYECL